MSDARNVWVFIEVVRGKNKRSQPGASWTGKKNGR